MRFLYLLIILLLTIFAQAQDHYLLRGYVYNEANQPMPSVNVRVYNSSLGTVTNSKGQYELLLSRGLHRLMFSSIGFETAQYEIVMSGDQIQNVWLKVADNEIAGIDVKVKKRDYSYEVIKNVIEHKSDFEHQYTTAKHRIYIKSVEDITYLNKADKDEVKDLEQELESLDTFGSSKPKVPRLNLYETEIVFHEQYPDKIKEEKIAAKKLADQRSLFYTSTTDADFDFYQNLLIFRKLGDNSYVSPFSPTTFLSYKFKLLGSYFEGDQKVYRIQITPRKHGNALLKGTIEVYDKIWALKKVEFDFPKNSLILYDAFSLSQEYCFVDSVHAVSKQEFKWKVKDNNVELNGYCFAKHSDYVFDSIYHKKYFNAELGFTAVDAYKKDTTFWNSIRPVPLTVKEQAFVRYQDSMYLLRNSKEYLDSIDSIFNRITFLKVAVMGFGHINRSEKKYWFFDPAVNLLDPLAIGGWRLKYSVSYFRRFENRKSISVTPFLNYGFLNKDIKGNIRVSHLYQPKKLSRISIDMGRYFGFVNNFATISDIFRRDNFYEQSYVYLNHSTELFNGFYLRTGLNYVDRKDLSDFKFAAVGDSLFENNNPISFPRNTNFMGTIGISYVPKQLYLQEPNEKIVLGSKYPTLSLNYRHSFRNILGSNNQYSYGEFAVDQSFNIGTIGTSEYRVSMGMFFDTTNLSVMDYKYQRGGDPYWFTPAMYTFQLIEQTFPTFQWFFESHYVHQFNGFLVGRIPGLKQAKIKSMGGGGFLYSPERNYQYSELFFGINRIFKIGRERLRIGVYYVAAQSNDFGFRSGLKFSLEPYNSESNTWSF